jgi:hypothetical protein
MKSLIEGGGWDDFICLSWDHVVGGCLKASTLAPPSLFLLPRLPGVMEPICRVYLVFLATVLQVVAVEGKKGGKGGKGGGGGGTTGGITVGIIAGMYAPNPAKLSEF